MTGAASPWSPTERLVALGIGDHMNDHGAAWPSVRKLAEWTGLHRATVMTAVKALCGDAGLFDVSPGGSPRRGERASNFYTLRPARDPSRRTTSRSPAARLVAQDDRSRRTTAPVVQDDTEGPMNVPVLNAVAVTHGSRATRPVAQDDQSAAGVPTPTNGARKERRTPSKRTSARSKREQRTTHRTASHNPPAQADAPPRPRALDVIDAYLAENGGRRVGHDARAVCPVCLAPDGLSVATGEDGRVLVHSFCCEKAAVLQALDLGEKDLFSTRPSGLAEEAAVGQSETLR